MPIRLFTPSFFALATATLVFYVASGIVIAAAPLFGREQLGLSNAMVGVAIAIYSIAALAMRPVVGWSTDRFGRRPSLVIGAILDASFGIAPVALGVVAEVGGYPLGFLAAGFVSAIGCVLLVLGSSPRGPARSRAATLGT